MFHFKTETNLPIAYILYCILIYLILESTKELLKCNMTTVVLNSELSLMSKPTIALVHVIDETCYSRPPKCGSPMSELKEIDCIATSLCNKLVAVASKHNIT